MKVDIYVVSWRHETPEYSQRFLRTTWLECNRNGRYRNGDNGVAFRSSVLLEHVGTLILFRRSFFYRRILCYNNIYEYYYCEYLLCGRFIVISQSWEYILFFYDHIVDILDMNSFITNSLFIQPGNNFSTHFLSNEVINVVARFSES